MTRPTGWHGEVRLPVSDVARRTGKRTCPCQPRRRNAHADLGAHHAEQHERQQRGRHQHAHHDDDPRRLRPAGGVGRSVVEIGAFHDNRCYTPACESPPPGRVDLPKTGAAPEAWRPLAGFRTYDPFMPKPFPKHLSPATRESLARPMAFADFLAKLPSKDRVNAEKRV